MVFPACTHINAWSPNTICPPIPGWSPLKKRVPIKQKTFQRTMVMTSWRTASGSCETLIFWPSMVEYEAARTIATRESTKVTGEWINRVSFIAIVNIISFWEMWRKMQCDFCYIEKWNILSTISTWWDCGKRDLILWKTSPLMPFLRILWWLSRAWCSIWWHFRLFLRKSGFSSSLSPPPSFVIPAHSLCHPRLGRADSTWHFSA